MSAQRIKLRLQGGPHDGDVRPVSADSLIPERVWVQRCYQCGSHWHPERIDGGDQYRRDGERGGYLIYVYTDETLSPDTRLATNRGELTGAPA